MAAITPATIEVHNVGDLKFTIATFTTIADNDTWASGIKSAVAWPVQSTIDGPQDCTIDAYDRTTGTFTFGSAAAQSGKVLVFSLDY